MRGWPASSSLAQPFTANPYHRTRTLDLPVLKTYNVPASSFRIASPAAILHLSNGQDESNAIEIKIVREAITKAELNEMAKQQFGDMVKAVVDVEQHIMAIGGELHSDEEAMLLDQGSVQKNLWGINLYPEQPATEWIEFDSMINVRPSGGNRSRYVESAEVRESITVIVSRLVKE